MTDRSRGKGVYFMVSDKERELIEQKMELAGIKSISAYLRKIAIDGYVIQLDLSDVRELNTLLRSVSNNMNQIARRANETRSIYEADIRDLQERYTGLYEKADGIMRELAKL